MSLSFRVSNRCVGVAVVGLALVLASCRQSPQVRSAEYIKNGKRLMENHDVPRAILQFRNAAQAMPGNPEAYYQLSLAYLSGGNMTEAVRFLNKTLQLDPKHQGAQLKLAQLMVDAGDQYLEEAQHRIAALLEMDPNNAEVLRTYALTELKMGKVEDALRYFDQAIAAAPQEVTLAAVAAQARLQAKDPKGAEEVLKKAVGNNPKVPDGHVILGRLYAGLGRTAEAEAEFRRALEMQPNHIGALANLATLLRNTGRKPEAEERFKRLAGLADPRVNYFYAFYLFDENRRDEGIRELERLAKNDPDDRDARTRLVAAYQYSKRSDDALRVLNAALKKNSKDIEAMLQRGQVLLETGKFADAEADLNSVARQKPDSPEVHFALSRLHLTRGALRFQRQELSEALRLNPQLLPVRLELARALTRDNVPKAALELLDEIPADQKNLPEVMEERNWALIAAGDAGAARMGIDQGLRGIRSGNLLLQDALVKLSQKDAKGARASAEEVLKHNPGDVRAVSVVAATYMAENQGAAALQKVREYAAQAQRFPAVQYYLGQMLSSSGNRQEARSAFNAAKSADQNFIDADVALAQLDVYEGKGDEARKRLNTLLGSRGDVLPARLLLAQLDIQGRNYGQAADYYRKLATDYPTNLVVLNNLAYSLAETGQYDEALKYAQQAKEMAPDRPDVDDTLGWVLYKKGVYTSAVQYLERAVSRDNSPVLNYHLGMAQVKAGNHKRGKEVLQAALKAAPGLPEAQMAQAVLAETVDTTGKK